ncbi:MAG TPA: BatD family protein [Bacteroidales bacterium]|nr:BatD family protein [Bacteroidales bacterium]
MKKFLILILFCCLVPGIKAQDDIRVNAEYPAEVVAGQQFMISFSVNAGGGEFTVPSFTGFTKILGPQTSYSQSTQIINGRMARQVTYSYIYYLIANREGEFEIPPAVFTIKNKEYLSDPIKIRVVADASQAQAGIAGEKNSDDKPAPSSDLFVNMILNRKEVYVGEPVLATVKLFTRVDLQGINEIKYPSFNSFLRTDIETPPLTSLKQENINGTMFGTGVLQQFLLFPQVPGEITIDPVQLSVIIQQRTGSPDPFFGDFFSSYQSVPRSIASRPVVVTVKALPGTKPDTFSGVVGKISLDASLSNDSVKVNDALTLKITLSGTGNMRVAATPALKLSPDIEVYDPKITDDFKNSVNGISGTRQFEYLLIPRHHGDFTIPPVSYNYFNTESGKYETVNTKEFNFHAIKTDDQGSGVTVYGGISKEDVKYLGRDIRFIKSEPGRFMAATAVLSSSTSFYLIYAFALFIFLLILFLRREFVRRNSDSSRVKNRKAAKIAGRRLHNAALCIKNKQFDKFHEEILKALWGYLSDKLSIPVSELSRENAISALILRGISDEKVQVLKNILDTCEYARFSPSASDTEAEKIYDGASQFIKSVENTIR